VGTQYRSEIFYHNEGRKKTEDYIGLMTAEDTTGCYEDFAGIKILKQKRCTKITIRIINPQGYCSYVITPKIDKLKKMFEDKLKNNEERNMAASESTKKEFILGILFDAWNVALLAFVWRVFRCYLGTDGSMWMTRMYKGTAGKGEGW
jgi:hypothetical protein